MENLYPESFARFYDVIYSSIRDGADNSYYAEKIAAAKGPILEVGAGTGRLYIPAVKSGADIYAIDNSPAMLQILKQKIDKSYHSRIFTQDIRTVDLDMKFDLVIAPFRVFGHLISREDQLSALNNIFKLLNPGGRFIFDLFVPDLDILRNGFNNHVDFEGEYAPGLFLRRIVNTENSILDQVTHIEFIIEWLENNKEERASWKTDLRFFFRYELENLIMLSSFTKFKIYGDFMENSLDANSKEFVIHCFKA